jgi:hypothetical protein
MEQNYLRGSKELTNILIQDSVIIGNVGGEPAQETEPTEVELPLRTEEETEYFRKKLLEALDCDIWNDEFREIVIEDIEYLYLDDEFLERKIEFYTGLKLSFIAKLDIIKRKNGGKDEIS